MEQELGRPDVVSDPEAVAPGQGAPPGSDYLAGGLYDDEAVVFADTSGLVDDDAMAELDIDASMLDTIEAELAAVELALALLDEGTYGRCDHCGRAIDDDVLARAPTTRFCAEHMPLSLP